ALFYALSTLTAVLTRSPIVSILICFVAWGLLLGLGWAFWFADCKPATASPDGTVGTVVKVIHTVSPHYIDFDWLADTVIKENILALSEEERIKLQAEGFGMLRWSESIVVTSLYIALLLGLSCWWFATRDY